jgi:hypothetical protein
MRTIVDIPEDQLQMLTELCRRDDLSRAEAIRRAIAAFLAKETSPPAESFGLWRGRGIEGVEYQQAIRSEWDR